MRAQHAHARSFATDLCHHLPELGLGDVRHAGVDDVHHLKRFQKPRKKTSATDKTRDEEGGTV